MKISRMHTIRTGDRVRMISGSHSDELIFLGFSDWKEPYSEVVEYIDWCAVAVSKGVSTFAALEARHDAREYGYSVRAVWWDLDAKMIFATYLYRGRWAVGSGADKYSLRTV